MTHVLSDSCSRPVDGKITMYAGFCLPFKGLESWHSGKELGRLRFEPQRDVTFKQVTEPLGGSFSLSI